MWRSRKRTTWRYLINNASALFRSSHPIPSVAVTALSCGLAISGKKGVGATIKIGLAVLTGQLAIGWQNDWLDVDKDITAKRGDKPIAVGQVKSSLVGTASVAGFATTLLLSRSTGAKSGIYHIAAVASGASYNILLRSSMLSPIPFAVSFGLLPQFVLFSNPSPRQCDKRIVAAASLLGVGAHFVNTIPDLADDRRAGINGLPQQIGPKWSLLAACSSLLAATSILTFTSPCRRQSILRDQSWFIHQGRLTNIKLAGFIASVILGLRVVSRAKKPSSRMAFNLTICIAFIDGLLVFLELAQDQP